jgi:hypothetical protein
MTNDEYNKLFHELNLNLVAFKPLMHCDQEVLKLVNAAIEAERKDCADIAEYWSCNGMPRTTLADQIRARGLE